MSERRTRIGMIVVGLVIWAVSIALPGWSLPGLVLGSAMVAWASFGLMVDKPDPD